MYMYTHTHTHVQILYFAITTLTNLTFVQKNIRP